MESVSNCTLDVALVQTKRRYCPRPLAKKQPMPSPSVRKSRPERSLTDEESELAAQAWRLAEPIIRRFRRWKSQPDYEGAVADRILRAVPSYDPSIGPFPNWIQRHIRGACLDAMRASRSFGPMYRTKNRNWTHHPIDSQGKEIYRAVSPFQLTSHDSPSLSKQREDFDALCQGLTERERRIARLYYGDLLTFRQIGEMLGVSESMICVNHATILSKLRARFDRQPRED